MRKIFFITAVSLTWLPIFSQSTKIDSLEYSFADLRGKAKVRAMLKLNERLLKDSSTLAVGFSKRTVEAANFTNDTKLLGESFWMKGASFLQVGNLDSAMAAYQSVLFVSEQSKDSLLSAKCLHQIGKINLLAAHLDDAALNFNKALNLSIAIKDSFSIAESHENLGDLAIANGENKASKEHYQLASNIFKQLSEARQDEIAQLKKHNVHNKRVRGVLFLLIGIAGVLAAFVSVLYKKKQHDNLALKHQNAENLRQQAAIEGLMNEQEMKNTSLQLLNKRLINEIGERESMERTSYAKDKFLATISHEMRTPLNAITGLLHLMLDNKPRPDQAEQLRALQFSANELVVFINDVLDFSKIEVGKIDSQTRSFDIHEIVKDLFHQFEAKALAKQLLFHHSFDGQIPQRVLGNEVRFHQILYNLFQNCCETTEKGLIQVALLLEGDFSKELILKLIVETTDGGVERKLVSLAEEEAVNFALNDDFDNWTLGLAITKKMVEMQHGKLTVENVFGEATRFTVYLPFKKMGNLAIYDQSLGAFDLSILSGHSILLVEDNKINQVIVSKLLRKFGMTVVTADNGADALNKLERGKFDLVLMDIQMPVMDGYRATSEIRSHENPAIHSLPIVALTSSAYVSEKEKAFLFGMNEHVGKPFSPEELMEKIAACLQLNKSVGPPV